MKKLLVAMCMLMLCFIAFGCAGQNFDDISYSSTKRTETEILDELYYGPARIKTRSLTAKYTTTITEKTPAGTSKVEIITLIGKVGNPARDIVQQQTRTYLNSKDYISETFTWYEGTRYREDNDGIVTSTEIDTSSIVENTFRNLFPIASEFPAVVEDTQGKKTGLGEKVFNKVRYFKFDIKISSISANDPFNVKPNKSDYIDSFSIEIGINEKTNYLQMFRINSVCINDIWDDTRGNWQITSQKQQTTLLTLYGKDNSGDDKVKFIIPQITPQP